MKLCFLFTTIMTTSTAWGAPAQKITDTVQVKESYSVAKPGMETEGYRIQHLVLDGKTSYMVSKLINGGLVIEKPLKISDYKMLKSFAQHLAAEKNNDLCDKPINFVMILNKKETKTKVCGEKDEVSGPTDEFFNHSRILLGLKEAH